MSGLEEPEEAFDVVVMVHPAMVERVRILQPSFSKPTPSSCRRSVQGLVHSSLLDSMALESASIIHTLVTSSSCLPYAGLS